MEEFNLIKFTTFAGCDSCGTQRCSPTEPEWREGCKAYKDYLTLNVTDKYVAFWGGPFSNFYPCKIVHHGHEFKSSEQLFMYCKATFFGDDDTVKEILKAKTPKEAKRLGRQVKDFNDEAWAEVREMMMYTAVYQKFKQNEDLKRYLTNRLMVFREFVEGSPADRIWGVGIKWDDPRIEDKENWKGLNLLGKVLNKVQDDILNEEAKFPDVKEVPEPEA